MPRPRPQALWMPQGMCVELIHRRVHSSHCGNRGLGPCRKVCVKRVSPVTCVHPPSKQSSKLQFGTESYRCDTHAGRCRKRCLKARRTRRPALHHKRRRCTGPALLWYRLETVMGARPLVAAEFTNGLSFRSLGERHECPYVAVSCTCL